MTDEIIKFIQSELRKLTKKKISKKYITHYILPIIKYIVLSKKKKFLISGSQGIGKSTLLIIIEKTLQSYYKLKVLRLSLDDYYLTKEERVALSKKIDPLLITRGVPGTHDIKKLLNNIENFDRLLYPILIPIFNKLSDERSKSKRLIKNKTDILILEGWCCGASPISKKYLLNNINSLEKENDKKKVWRNYYNNQLKNDYAKLFKVFDKTIFLKASSFSFIFNWRLNQEKMMGSKKNNKKLMNEKNILYFISHYEKLTKWMFKTLPSKADLVININREQKIEKINYN